MNAKRWRHGDVPVRGESTDLRRRILDAARKILVQDGHEATSMRAIAKRIGYSTPAIYQHFGSKEELVREICYRDFRGLSATFFFHVAVTKDPVERLRRMGRSYLDFALRHPRQYAFLFMNVQSTPGTDDDLEDGDPIDGAYVFLFATVGEAHSQGRLRPNLGDPDRVAQLFWGSLHGIAALHIARPHHNWLDGGDLVSLSETTIDVMLRGVLRIEELK